MKEKRIKIAVVGDVHQLWNDYDAEALEFLGVDLVLFVGDFGNEDVEVVRKIAELPLPKAAICGNHDAWYTATEWGRRKCPYNRNVEDRVQIQLDLLGECHVGYSYLDFPQFNLTVVGSRPFSWGGGEWKCEEFYRQRYGVNNFNESVAKILESVSRARYNNVIFIGHNGPFGLGDKPEDSCGRDWQPLGGDFGDPDFQRAIILTREMGKVVPLVAFGHMHHTLRHTKERLRTIVNIDQEGTVYLNAAATPRIQEGVHKFSVVHIVDEKVEKINLIGINETMEIIEKRSLFQASSPPPLREMSLANCCF
ncbi:MAG: TIGR04168 family protein [Geminocystis sp.]|nr:TIGR04168 family protein [Geminocystis sp.]HIK38499.1 TIGR04168 family protein [Geminocystis sp. M7585_C2015_104]MCS7147548.1 TIGR04168 family protein [Geminocystis sp.]MCX8077951.1 TIGR04168 family protein [Geminocystis sp.]MDW8115241.1 TIGR04168 family protein [Geminocystis sp.]